MSNKLTESSYSVPMTLKGDPDKNVKRVLAKHGYEDILSDVSDWASRETTSPGGLKKQFIGMMSGVDFYEIDLKDSTTWGNTEDVPSDEFFIELSTAIKADEKRRAARKSYEF